MKDLYLKAPSKEAFINDLKNIAITVGGQVRDVGFVIQDEEGNDVLAQSGRGFALDYVGEIVVQSGTYTEEGEEITPPVKAEGAHVNIRIYNLPIKNTLPKQFDSTSMKIEDALKAKEFTHGTEILDPAPSTPVRKWA